MNDAELISKIESIVRSKKVYWVQGDYIRAGETVHWECFIRPLEDSVAVGFDEYFGKYEDAVDMYEAYIRNKLPNIKAAVEFVLNSFPLAAEKMRVR
ncbi:hypothetical protein ACSFBI_16655 [Variovorax sp. RB3P1]|uniref:hypothetical protein n=1 Tax=Variovorax sp. RB3P1 TaxID=3443732 RepID=UPI003F483AD6